LMFQSTRLHEARLPIFLMNEDGKLFQSTRLHEARRNQKYFHWELTGFNPRACMRRDLRSGAMDSTSLVSIHAPA